jgi:glutaredoxin
MTVEMVLKCIDYYYDSSEGILTLYNVNTENNERKIIYFNKSDLTNRGKPVSDEDVIKTAEMWKGKVWRHIMKDDPNMDCGENDKGMTEAEYRRHEKIYMDHIGDRALKSIDNNLDEVIRQKLKVITSQHCPDCKAYVRYLNAEGFAYVLYDGDSDQNQDQLDEWRVSRFPVVQILTQEGNLVHQFPCGSISIRQIIHKIKKWRHKDDISRAVVISDSERSRQESQNIEEHSEDEIHK